MPTTCHKDPAGFKCAKEKLSPQKSTEAELWLNMMTSMLNFAMASTTLMKSIQNRVEVTKKLEDEARAMRAAEFFRQELAKSMPNDASEDFSLRSEPVREDTCGEHTCTLLFRKKEPDECGPSCDGKKSAGPKKIPLSTKKRKPCQESVDTIGGSCLCLIPLPEEPSEADMDKTDEDTCSCAQIKACMVDDDEEPSCVCSDDEVKDEGTKIICEPQVICRANMSLDDLEKSDDCSCPSFGCKEDQASPEEPPATEEEPEAAAECKGAVVEEEPSIIDCGCQTTSSQELMIKELQFANLAYQLRQTDKNLKELKREMDRINNFVGGKKKCSYATAAALYEEIMKPRTPIDDVSRSSSRRRRR
ncbi:uncharacterized protein LOC123312866 [Coccinella septempunctata]|uniref:uncharacterized protein LOC123312866 n=1 Tax=Coccinella septempunctata TaxID=41139 RepID=UPI001D092D61|nr:uncharacterized protein LOC123312866 [Coccinella septempunctata]